MRKTIAVCLGFLGLVVAGVAYGDGLDATYGKDLPSIELKGKTFKILRKGELKAGESIQLKKVLFEKNAKCIALAIGEGEGSDMDIFLTDSDNGKLIGKDELLDNIPVVEWSSGAADKFLVDIKLLNAGKVTGKYVLLANW